MKKIILWMTYHDDKQIEEYHLKEEQKSKQIEDITSLSIQCRLATHDEPERTKKYYSLRSLHMWLTCILKLK